MKRFILLVLMSSFLVSCGSRKVHKEETVSKIKEKEVVSKSEETEISANKQINENILYIADNFQADSIVVTTDGTKYYNPRSKKEVLSSDKKEVQNVEIKEVAKEDLSSEVMINQTHSTKEVEKEQVNYFKMIFQFWPILLLAIIAYFIFKYWSRIKVLF